MSDFDFEVVTPFYNTAPEHLAEAVYSMLNQTGVPAFNIVLCSDGCTNPGTLAMAEHIEKSHACVTLQRFDKIGKAAVLNRVLRSSSCPYVALMDSDDYAHPARLQLQIAYIKKHRPDVLGTNLYAFKSDDIYRKPLYVTNHPEKPFRPDGWLVNHGTVLYRTEAVLATGGYNEKFERGQDVELWRRMAQQNFTFRNLTQVLYAWRRYQ